VCLLFTTDQEINRRQGNCLLLPQCSYTYGDSRECRQKLCTVISLFRNHITTKKHRKHNKWLSVILYTSDLSLCISIKMCTFYFCDNFGKYKPVLIIFHYRILRWTSEKAAVKFTNSPEIRCRTTLRKLNDRLHRTPFILARIRPKYRPIHQTLSCSETSDDTLGAISVWEIYLWLTTYFLSAANV